MSATNQSAPPALALSAITARYPYANGVLACLTATLSFGIMFPVMTGALTRIDPFTFTSLRYLIAGTAFLALLIVKEGHAGLRLKGERAFLAWFLGSLGFGGFGFFVFLGQQLAGREGALTASVMMATQPMLGLLVNALVRKIAPPFLSFVFVLLSFFGVTLVVTKGNILGLINEPQHYAANALIVLGALCWVIYTFSAMFFTKWSALKYTTMTTWLGLTSIITINCILFALHAIPVPSTDDLVAIAPHLVYMGLVAGFVGILCWNLGNKILTPLNGVLFMDVVPITSFIVSTLQGIVPVRAQVLGAAVTGTALIMNNLYLRSRARASAASPAQAAIVKR